MEKFYYFGYASNLHQATLDSRLKFKAEKTAVGVLPHFGFRFNHLNDDGSARANIVPSQNESVYGVIYEISSENFDHFLTSEPGYDFVKKEIFIKNGKIEAYTFLSTKTEIGIFPKEDYWQTIILGGKEHNLPNGYLAQIINRVGKV
ncbi:gamma-glutamylcyclotransferase family protein [Aquiflexum lacus]|uniref:gamma-glutamylcyclotransferase family protein n=1 Tax=Aquiflexum lacus TaxID=2483805 RepID=UPI0018952001|nr:gamma-glutamylcyclotransferase family protein [Aquiflexum lacus]